MWHTSSELRRIAEDISRGSVTTLPELAYRVKQIAETLADAIDKLENSDSELLA